MENSTLESVNKFYDQGLMRAEQDFDKIGFFNLGYWKGVDGSVEIAQINLIETLVSFFNTRDGNVLDVACGKGASSQFLTKYFDPQAVTGINISERQLQICRAIAPACNFKLMDATKLEFSDTSFDNILCIEAAQHFTTRYNFLEQAYRVLKPGGRLAMSDVVLHDYHLVELLPPEWPKGIYPKENCVPSLDAYRDDLFKVGFKHVRVEDSTELSVTAFLAFQIRKTEKEFDKKPDYKALEVLRDQQMRWRPYWSWCMTYAIK